MSKAPLRSPSSRRNSLPMPKMNCMLRLVLTMLLAGAVSGLAARDDQPELPSPGRLQHGPIRATSVSGTDAPLLHGPGQEKPGGARAFPARSYAAIVDEWRQWRSSMLETADLSKERALRSKLRSLLPRESYTFGADCPLRKTGAVGVIQFRITCLPDEDPFIVQFPRGRDDTVRTQLDLMQAGREITAEVRLLDSDLTSQAVRIVLRETQFHYTNQFLERLRELSPGMGESAMLRPEWVMRHIGSLAGGRRYADSALKEIAEVLKTGEYYPVNEQCPLNLDAKDRLDAENTYRLEFSFACIRGASTSIRMGERELENESEIAGTGRYLGELRLASVLLVDGRLFLDWDAIRNVRAMRKP